MKLPICPLFHALTPHTIELDMSLTKEQGTPTVRTSQLQSRRRS